MAEKCAVCAAKGSMVCAQCRGTFYCNKEHQKKHWNEHRKTCKPYDIQVSDKLGRFMVSKRDIKAGELILRENPLIVGPRTNSQLLCLGCHKVLSSGNYKLCPKCKVAPVCSDECAQKPPHSEVECRFYREWFTDNLKHDFLVSKFHIVTPLRSLFLKLKQKGGPNDEWESFINLESHIEERENREIWRYYQENIVNFLQSTGILQADDCILLHRICGILDVNSFEIRGPTSPDFPQGERLRGVYLEAALMAHDCLGNTHLSVDENYVMTIHASAPIKEGEPILFNYASSLESTSERLQRLKEGKYFMCTCKRCSDPTELGTYMGSIICSRCHAGFVIPVDPLSNLNQWLCEKCNHKFLDRLIKTTISEGRSLINATDSMDPRALETLLQKCLKSFPPMNVIIIEIKQKLVACYRDKILREPSPSRNILRKTISLCQELLQCLDIVEPGISRLRGIACYELHKPKVILASKEHDSGEITSTEFHQKLLESESILKEAVSILIYEPVNSPEGELLKVAITELKLLRETISDVNFLANNEPLKKGKPHKSCKKNKNFK